MCGIVGYVGKRDALSVLMKGLEHLEYRGYDSAGVACIDEKAGGLFVLKEEGKLSRLKESLKKHSVVSTVGIGHTRWATHGEPSRVNAHPHTDCKGQIALVHNGIIENYALLKEELKRRGVAFRSKTDTEIAVNLIGDYYRRKRDLVEAFRKAVGRLRGFFAFVILAGNDPDKLLVFKRSNPIVIGLGKGENFVASDVSALLPYTKNVIYLEDDEYALLTRKDVRIYNLGTGKAVKRKPAVIRWNIRQAQKGGYPHFMLKEIHEEPRILEEIITKRIDRRGNVYFDTLGRGADLRLKKIKRVFFVSCGTAYHAGLVGSYLAEQFARLPAGAEVSSEFRYRDPVLHSSDAVILITQSGETADTLAALREAKAKGAFTLAIVNVVGSTIAREANAVIYTHAGPEIGVASTKAYTAQLVTEALFTFYLAGLHQTMKRTQVSELLLALKKVPAACEKILKQSEALDRCSRKYFRHQNFLYLGRGYNFPTALEGALKLKEISYAHAHGYAAGEMKHGPIALVDHKQPVICIAPASKTYEKMISNVEEIKARGGIVIALGTEGDRRLAELADDFFPLPPTHEVFSPILAAIPLQLFAYKIAAFNGRDVDQPRNLAKSVTVE